MSGWFGFGLTFFSKNQTKLIMVGFFFPTPNQIKPNHSQIFFLGLTRIIRLVRFVGFICIPLIALMYLHMRSKLVLEYA